ncbi:MAG: peptidoglycan DD-metalloendopeptidase family protein [Bacilli bacterium]|jgi:murein DD-endopeptidase MepM/ murein hydrolase activator NlpD
MDEQEKDSELEQLSPSSEDSTPVESFDDGEYGESDIEGYNNQALSDNPSQKKDSFAGRPEKGSNSSNNYSRSTTNKAGSVAKTPNQLKPNNKAVSSSNKSRNLGTPAGGLAKGAGAVGGASKVLPGKLGMMAGADKNSKPSINKQEQANPKTDEKKDSEATKSSENSNSAVENLAASTNKAVNTAMKVKKYWPIIAAVAPIVGWILVGFLIIILLLIPILFFAQISEAIAEGFDKFLNFMSGEGFDSSENVFYKNLDGQFIQFEKYHYKEGKFDSALLASTIHYSVIVDPDGYDHSDEEKEEDYSYDDASPVVETKSNRNFYVQANDQLGSAYSLVPLQKGLIGNLIDTKITMDCVNLPQGWDILSPSAWSDVAGTMVDSFTDLYNTFSAIIKETGKDLTQTNFLYFIRLLFAYAGEDESYIESKLAEAKYEITDRNAFSELVRIIKQSSFVDTCTDGQLALPVVTKYINYNLYENYLRENYLPRQSYNLCDTCAYNIAKNDPEKQKKIIETEITEIFDQRDAYAYLQNVEIKGASTQYIPGMSSLPIQVSSGENWNVNVSRGYQLGNAECFENGEYTGKSDCDHLGIDFSYPIGTPVLAIADGLVLEASNNADGYGLYVKIAHDINGDGKYDYYSLYAHLSKQYVSDRDMIGGGQQIGEVGSTGNSTGPHLHFTLMDIDGKKIDPATILNGIQSGTSEFNNSNITKYYNQSTYSYVPYCKGMFVGEAEATIQNAGSIPTAYAMIISNIQNNIAKDPLYVGNYICESASSYRTEDSGTNPDFFTDYTVESYFKIAATKVGKAEANFDKISSILKEGHPIIVNVLKGPFNLNESGHYIVLDEIDENNNIKVLDPGSKDLTKNYTKEQVESDIIAYIDAGIWYFEGGH